MAVIKADHLTKRFGKKVLAVDDVSFVDRGGDDHRRARTQRRRQDDHPAHDPRSGAADGGLGDHPREPLPGSARARRKGRRAPRLLRVPPRPLRAQRPARDRHRSRRLRRARGRDARARRARGRRQARGQGLLDRHEAAPRARGGAARRSRGAHPRRARQRPRPRGDAVAAHVPAQAGRRGPHGRGLEPRPRGSGADRRRHPDHEQGKTPRPGTHPRADRSRRSRWCACARHRPRSWRPRSSPPARPSTA